MPKPKRPGTECEACEGRGFLWGELDWPVQGGRVIERCDVCERFDSDQAAARRVHATLPELWFTWGVVRDPSPGAERSCTVLFEKG